MIPHRRLIPAKMPVTIQPADVQMCARWCELYADDKPGVSIGATSATSSPFSTLSSLCRRLKTLNLRLEVVPERIVGHRVGNVDHTHAERFARPFLERIPLLLIHEIRVVPVEESGAVLAVLDALVLERQAERLVVAVELEVLAGRVPKEIGRMEGKGARSIVSRIRRQRCSCPRWILFSGGSRRSRRPRDPAAGPNDIAGARWYITTAANTNSDPRKRMRYRYL
jgi:hypothetical protein